MDTNSWKLLIVDDDEDDYILTRHMLSEARRGKFTLDWASNYKDGMQMIQQGGYDAILMDYDLGPHNGLDLTVKAIQQGTQTPIILFTGRGSYEIDLEAMRAGATLYLNKSETSACMLERSIRYAIERKQIEISLLLRTQELEAARAEAVKEKRRLEAVMSALPVGVAITDMEGGSVRSNNMFEQVWGLPLPQADSFEDYEKYVAWWADTGQPLQPEEWAAAQVIQKGEAVIKQILQIQRFDGSLAYVQNSAAPVLDHTGKIVGSAVVIEDITSLLNIQRALHESEEQIKAFTKAIPVGMGIFSAPDETYLYANSAWEKIFGHSKDELMSLKPADLTWELMDHEHLTTTLGEKGIVAESRIRLKKKDGTPFWATLSIHPINFGGNPAFLETIIEVSDLEAARQRETEARYHDLIQDAPAAFYEVDFRTGRFTTINDAMCTLSGYSREELLSMTAFDILDDEGKTLFRERIKRWLAGEQPAKNVEYKVKAKDGHTIYALLNINFTKDADGNPLGATVVGFDVTDRKRVEDELHENQKFLKRLVETSFEGIWSIDQNGRTTFVNQRAAEILGYTVEEIQGENAFQFLMAEDVEAGLQTLEHISKGQSGRVESHARHRDGHELWLLTSYSPIINEQGEFEGALAMFSDITDRKRADAVLKESEKRFRDMADGSPSMIWLTTADMQTEFINLAYSKFFGVTLEQIQAIGWDGFVHPDDLATIVDIYSECHQHQKPFHEEACVKRADGEWRWIEAYAQPRFSSSGEFLGMVGSGIDTSERKRMEQALRDYTERLRSSNEELEKFAFTASHDLKEPLRKIEVFGDLLAQSAGPSLNKTECDYLERMQKAASRMGKMIDDLLALSRVTTQGQPFTEINLNRIAKTVLEDLEARVRQTGGRVELGELPVIEADPLQMHQLFLNLISNGLKFHREGSPPCVKVRSNSLPEGQVEIHVEDNGIGFDMDQVSHLFQPFQRLHSRQEYEGTGIGLSICRKIVERHHGTIRASGKAGEGAEFIISLPIRQPA